MQPPFYPSPPEHQPLAASTSLHHRPIAAGRAGPPRSHPASAAASRMPPSPLESVPPSRAAGGSSSTGAPPPNKASSTPALLAQHTAEMICYLWFSPSLSLSSHSLRSTPSSPLLHSHTRIGLTPVVPLPGGGLGASSSAAHSPPLAQAPPSTTTAHLPLHLAPSPRFTKFVRATLQMTAVAPHVVLLGLLLLDRYRASTREPSPAAGSEYRLFVTSLLIANKVLDDNSYTNRTWASVTKMDLLELNSMENQFLSGIAFDLWTSSEEFCTWLTRLSGLYQARKDAAANYIGGPLPTPTSCASFGSGALSPLTTAASRSFPLTLPQSAPSMFQPPESAQVRWDQPYPIMGQPYGQSASQPMCNTFPGSSYISPRRTQQPSFFSMAGASHLPPQPLPQLVQQQVQQQLETALLPTPPDLINTFTDLASRRRGSFPTADSGGPVGGMPTPTTFGAPSTSTASRKRAAAEAFFSPAGSGSVNGQPVGQQQQQQRSNSSPVAPPAKRAARISCSSYAGAAVAAATCASFAGGRLPQEQVPSTSTAFSVQPMPLKLQIPAQPPLDMCPPRMTTPSTRVSPQTAFLGTGVRGHGHGPRDAWESMRPIPGILAAPYLGHLSQDCSDGSAPPQLFVYNVVPSPAGSPAFAPTSSYSKVQIRPYVPPAYPPTTFTFPYPISTAAGNGNGSSTSRAPSELAWPVVNGHQLQQQWQPQQPQAQPRPQPITFRPSSSGAPFAGAITSSTVPEDESRLSSIERWRRKVATGLPEA